MKEKDNNNIDIRKNKKDENQNSLEHLNKKRKLQNKVLKKMVENLNNQEKESSGKK